MEKYKVYSQGWCYWICGNTNIHITVLNGFADIFAKEIGVTIDKVVFDGVISQSDWCKNFQLFGAPVENCPIGYNKIETNIWNYLKNN